MNEIGHGVRVFVYHFATSGLEFLLLRPKPSQESFWGPIRGEIQPAENLERAVLRNVRQEIGLHRAEQLVDLELREVSRFGDFQQVDWIFGLQAPSSLQQLAPAPDIAEWQWAVFPSIYERLDSDVNRRAVMRLQTLLAG
ncbi:MAG: NUDIX domain-containing protein [Planctomycetes bacterium]|nr:NUDIX domain-containing protein [Planctomycetota bacterium]